ncbi:hypothetical protein RV14_GL000348 [Enterococcus ratti]|uniref:Uncharacterized protein n=1 Tax=Enterococcus ratti TaxID=150033 RepID=A0A1L8WJJ6_9ENTE|nr:hypothetical protein RV14_GL000348 [Enterococcus ratti]
MFHNLKGGKQIENFIFLALMFFLFVSQFSDVKQKFILTLVKDFLTDPRFLFLNLRNLGRIMLKMLTR